MRRKIIIGLALASLLATPVAPEARVLESPASGGVLSGVGFISGWKCNARNITVTIDGGPHQAVAMYQERGDLRAVCGTIRHGFIMQVNWNLLGDGAHTVTAYDGGFEFGRARFRVGTPGEEFLRGVRRRTVVDAFPSPGESTVLEWNQSTQHFEILNIMGTENERPGFVDEEWWRSYNEEILDGTYSTEAFLYNVLPDLNSCDEGVLSLGAQIRALEAVNKIRALHGLSALLYSNLYQSEVQQTALVQAANEYLNHQPVDTDMCWSQAALDGSSTSNLASAIGTNGAGIDRDPAEVLARLVNDSGNVGLVAAVGHRRWVLNPFLINFAYGQVLGYSTHKVFGFYDEAPAVARVEVDYIAFPYKVYPFNLVQNNPPWSFSVIEDKTDWNGNRFDYFSGAEVRVTRESDGVGLVVSDNYTDTILAGTPNILSWRVASWDWDTLYQVQISNVTMQSGERRTFSYPVLIERESLDPLRTR